jgi:hypothetical protein
MQDWKPVNRAERMRWRGLFIEARAGRYANQAMCQHLSTERVVTFGETIPLVRDGVVLDEV